ncbi:MAG: bifunctional 2-polyprenyl-6-hydroxyphenol methylase/3-demethylubiquinol 3-O-methyltransferase UbiG [Acetobacteraceae bacterium]
MRDPPTSTAASAEIARFDALAASWWDSAGPMRMLHRMNPARLAWIGARVGRRFADPASVRLLDVGCGAGLAAEGFARLGYRVRGIDAAPAPIEAARAHAAEAGLAVEYMVATPEALAAAGERFTVVSALEVIEHVPDPAAFLAALAALLVPGGLLFLSTLNRTLRSLALAKVGAEYVLRLLPPGTHAWRNFLTPAEMDPLLAQAGLRLSDLAGLAYDPLRGTWRTGRDSSVNYLLMAERG